MNATCWFTCSLLHLGIFFSENWTNVTLSVARPDRARQSVKDSPYYSISSLLWERCIDWWGFLLFDRGRTTIELNWMHLIDTLDTRLDAKCSITDQIRSVFFSFLRASDPSRELFIVGFVGKRALPYFQICLSWICAAIHLLVWAQSQRHTHLCGIGGGWSLRNAKNDGMIFVAQNGIRRSCREKRSKSGIG